MQPQEMLTAMEADPGLKEKMQTDPVRTLETLAAMPLRNDRWIYRAIISFFGIVVIATVAGGLALAWFDKTLPGELTTLAATVAGAMAGLLKLTGD